MSAEPSLLADTHCHTGEGPLYHPEEDALYWVDIPRGELFRHSFSTDEYERVLSIDGGIGGFTLEASGDLLLFGDEGRIQPWSAETGLGTPVIERIEGEEGERFNDVIAGPQGRVYAGTTGLETEDGTLYRVETDGTVTPVETGLTIPNGLGFTPDRTGLYFTETVQQRIYRYDFDEPTGALSNREEFVVAEAVEGAPDGMTVDAGGDVWSAFWDGSRLTRYDPDGVEQERIAFPAKKVSSITFGPPEYRRAYVTTALGPGDGPPGSRQDEGAGAGGVFVVDLGVEGVPEFRSTVTE